MTKQEISDLLSSKIETGMTPDEKVDVSELIFELPEEEQGELLDVLNEVPETVEAEDVPSYKIWKFTTPKDVRQINYKTDLNTRLHPDMKFNRGELINVDYYAQYDGSSFSDKVLSVSIEWLRNDEGRLVERRETREWVMSDSDDFGPDVKVTSKFYTPEMAAIADSRRRENIVNDILSLAGFFGLQKEASEIFLQYDDIISAYVKTSDKSIIQLFSAAPNEWLDQEVPTRPGQTFRQLIIWNLDV